MMVNVLSSTFSIVMALRRLCDATVRTPARSRSVNDSNQLPQAIILIAYLYGCQDVVHVNCNL